MLDWQESEPNRFHYEVEGWQLDVVDWGKGSAWYASYCGRRMSWANSKDPAEAKLAAEQYLAMELSQET